MSVRLPFSLLAIPILGLSLSGLGCAGSPDAAPPSLDPSSRRELSTGPVVGATGAHGSHFWRAIPFAAPPVGERRWRAPEPPLAWEGVREAISPAAACPQFASAFAGASRDAKGTIGQEDCLTLDVYAPRKEATAETSEPLPVMVWIHGGGNTIGTRPLLRRGPPGRRARAWWSW